MKLTIFLTLTLLFASGCRPEREGIIVNYNAAVRLPGNTRIVNSTTVTAGGSTLERGNTNAANVISVDPPMRRLPGTDPQSLPKPMPTGSVSTDPLPKPKSKVPRSREEIEIANKLKSGSPLNP